MFSTLTINVSNINQRPTLIPPDLKTQQEDLREDIAIGDLHASIRKLLFFLAMHGFYRLTEEHFTQFCKLEKELSALLNNDDEPEKADKINAYCTQLIHLLSLPPESYDTNIKAIIIGDDTADRNHDFDILIYLLYHQMNLYGIQYDILLSNHGAESILAYERMLKNPNERFDTRYLMREQAPSMCNMNLLIENYPDSRQLILDLIRDDYLPKIKLISYTLREDCITLYTHAPAGLTHIQTLAEVFDVPYHDETTYELAATIDAINHAFQEKCIKQNRLDDYFKNDGVLCRFVWRREFDLANLPALNPRGGYRMNHVCGHTLDPLIRDDHVCQLDNEFAKYSEDEYDKGQYLVCKAIGKKNIQPDDPYSEIIDCSEKPQLLKLIDDLLSCHALPNNKIILRCLQDEQLTVTHIRGLLYTLTKLKNLYSLNAAILNALHNIGSDAWHDSLNLIIQSSCHNALIFSVIMQRLRQNQPVHDPLLRTIALHPAILHAQFATTLACSVKIDHIKNFIMQFIFSSHSMRSMATHDDIDFLITAHDHEHRIRAIHEDMSRHWPTHIHRQHMLAYVKRIVQYELERKKINTQQNSASILRILFYFSKEFSLDKEITFFLIKRHASQNKLIRAYKKIKQHLRKQPLTEVGEQKQAERETALHFISEASKFKFFKKDTTPPGTPKSKLLTNSHDQAFFKAIKAKQEQLQAGNNPLYHHTGHSATK